MDRGTRVQAEQRGRWGEQVPFQPRWPMAKESWGPKETCQEHLQLGSELPLSELPTSHAEASFLLPTTLTLALTLAFSKMIFFFSQKLLSFPVWPLYVLQLQVCSERALHGPSNRQVPMSFSYSCFPLLPGSQTCFFLCSWPWLVALSSTHLSRQEALNPSWIPVSSTRSLLVTLVLPCKWLIYRSLPLHPKDPCPSQLCPPWLQFSLTSHPHSQSILYSTGRVTV